MSYLTADHKIPLIAVPVMPSDEAAAVSLVRSALDAGADMIELRADILYREGENPQASDVIRAVAGTAGDVPVIYTLRTKSQGGNADPDGEAYAGIVEKVLQEGLFPYVDIEYRQPSAAYLTQAAHRAGAKVILSDHCFYGTPDFQSLKDLFFRMEEMGGDIAKCACMPNCAGDADRMIAASAMVTGKLGIPHIAISMGEAGKDSRLSGEVFGSCITFGCLPGQESAPGQANAESLRKELEAVHSIREKGGFVFLNGFMGVGKTRTSRRLSRLLNLPVIEMDERIEQAEGRSISGIFAADGEGYFRDLETHALSSLYREGPALVSCGGGAVLREENRALMRALGAAVLLTATPETVISRLEGEEDNRPNIRNRMTVEAAAGLMEERRKYYEDSADISVATDGKRTDEICREIMEALAKTQLL